jgi:hypothetical protein
VCLSQISITLVSFTESGDGKDSNKNVEMGSMWKWSWPVLRRNTKNELRLFYFVSGATDVPCEFVFAIVRSGADSVVQTRAFRE